MTFRYSPPVSSCQELHLTDALELPWRRFLEQIFGRHRSFDHQAVVQERRECVGMHCGISVPPSRGLQYLLEQNNMVRCKLQHLILVRNRSCGLISTGTKRIKVRYEYLQSEKHSNNKVVQKANIFIQLKFSHHRSRIYWLVHRHMASNKRTVCCP